MFRAILLYEFLSTERKNIADEDTLYLWLHQQTCVWVRRSHVLLETVRSPDKFGQTQFHRSMALEGTRVEIKETVEQHFYSEQYNWIHNLNSV